MMYGFGLGWGWMWFGIALLILILAALIVLIVSTFTVGASASDKKLPPAQASSARQIAEERLARGELTPDEFREVARAIAERP